MRKGLLFLSALMMLLASCRKDVEEITIIDTGFQTPIVTETVTAGLAGLIVTEGDVPVPNATVRLGSQVVVSNEDGLFLFPDMLMNTRGSYVIVEGSGYFHGSKRFYPRENTRTIIKVELLPLNIVGSINATNGGAVTFEGAQISLPPNGVVTQAGQAYSGEVQIAAHWLNPVANNLEDIMPGNLEGLTAEGENVAMATFGMLAVELFDAAGNELQVAPEQQAELRFPLPAEISGTAPQEIPLWSFDEVEGLWMEEGSAQLQNGTYVGGVSHFSFWNCDLPIPYVFVKGRAVDANGNPLENRTVVIRDNSNNRMGYTITSVGGGFAGLVPANQVFEIGLLDDCGQVTATQTIGPFSEDTDLGDLVFNLSVSTFSVSGQAVGCQDEPLADVFVQVDYSGRALLLMTDENGDFSNTYVNCADAAELTINIIDLENQNESGPQNFPIESEINTGPIAVCEEGPEAFYRSTVNGNDYLTTVMDYSEVTRFDSTLQESVPLFIVAGQTDTTAQNQFFARLRLSDISVGVVGDQYKSFTYVEQSNGLESVFISAQEEELDALEIIITRNDEVIGGFWEGQYSGVLPARTANGPIGDVPVSGSFRVRIDE